MIDVIVIVIIIIIIIIILSVAITCSPPLLTHARSSSGDEGLYGRAQNGEDELGAARHGDIIIITRTISHRQCQHHVPAPSTI
jgi:hypothetical protein